MRFNASGAAMATPTFSVSSRRDRYVPDHAFALTDRCLDFRANIIIAGFLPPHPAMLGDLLMRWSRRVGAVPADGPCCAGYYIHYIKGAQSRSA